MSSKDGEGRGERRGKAWRSELENKSEREAEPDAQVPSAMRALIFPSRANPKAKKKNELPNRTVGTYFSSLFFSFNQLKTSSPQNTFPKSNQKIHPKFKQQQQGSGLGNTARPPRRDMCVYPHAPVCDVF
jgi:hypothetical protein